VLQQKFQELQRLALQAVLHFIPGEFSGLQVQLELAKADQWRSLGVSRFGCSGHSDSPS
jgi:hypothetical protein